MDSASSQSEQSLRSPDQLPSRGADPRELAQAHPKDAARRLGEKPDKNNQEPEGLMRLRRPLRAQVEVRADVHCQCLNPSAFLFEPCYYQVNWPQEVLQRWAREKEDRERNLCLDDCQDAAVRRSNTLDEVPGEQPSGYGELEAKKSDSWSTYH